MGLEKRFLFTINTVFFLFVQNPHMYLMAAVFSLTGYLGINFVLVLVRSFGALLAVTGIQSNGYSAASVVQHNIIQCHGYL